MARVQIRHAEVLLGYPVLHWMFAEGAARLIRNSGLSLPEA
jgi:hypothetical protein